MSDFRKINELIDEVEGKLSINFKERVDLDKDKKNLIRELQKNLLEEAKEKGFSEDVEVEFFRESLGMKKPFKTYIMSIFIDTSMKDERSLRAILTVNPKEAHNKFFPNPTLEELTVIK